MNNPRVFTQHDVRPLYSRLNFIFALALALLCASIGAATFAQVPGVGIKTDFGVYAPLSLPVLPAAGGRFNDPVFGTEIMRVTDERDSADGAGTSYSYWPSFNADNTRLLVMGAGGAAGAVIYDFNPDTFRLGAKQALPLNNGGYPFSYDLTWSHNEPDILYGHSGAAVWRYNARSRTYALAFDLASRLPAGYYFAQASLSADDDVFACTLQQSGTWAVVGYLAYRRSTDTILYTSSDNHNEVRVDKSGRFLFVNTNDMGVGKDEVRIIDLLTKQITNLRDDAPDHAPSHYDVGTGTAVGNGNYLVGISARNLSTPHSYNKILDLSGERNYGGFHLSMLADNEEWSLVSFYTPHVNGVMQGEVVQVATDGSGRVRRLFHHQAIVGTYYDSPRANISRDGRLVAFTSNWGVSGGRRDMFVARIEPAPSSSASPTPTPTPTPTPVIVPVPSGAGDVVWFEGAVPAGATPEADSDVWEWVTNSPASFSGYPVHRSSVHPAFHQHHFFNATNTMRPAAGDKIFTYVYLDPNNLPNEVMLQWHEQGQGVEGWEHRVYWGASNINWGVEGTNSRRYMGALPAAGQWVRLEVSASQVGLEGKNVDGMAFTLHGGRASWDRTGRNTVASATPTPTPTATPTPTPTTALTAPALVAAARSTAAALAGAPSVSAAEIGVLENSIAGAYAAFIKEANQFTASVQIEGGLRVSLYFARAAKALAEAGAPSPSVQNRLQIIASRLAQVSNFMLPNANGTSAENAHAPAATNLPFIGAANTFSSASMSPVLSPLSLGTITGDASQSPLAATGVIADTGGGKAPPFELAGASVSINGRAAPLLYVSPARIAFLVPQGLPQGEVEVIVTSQDGYVSRGTVTINPFVPALFTADASGAGAALLMNVSEPAAASFEVVSPHAFGADKRTRVSLYATGISASAANLSTQNDVRAAGGGMIANVAESVTVEARTRDGRLYHLPVEFAGAVEGRLPGLDQVNIVLHAELRGAGLVDLTVIINGQRSNTASINIR
jgi:uncharacterized protein (TIGR03437 family)